MLTLLFWNMKKKDIVDLAAKACQERDVDILIDTPGTAQQGFRDRCQAADRPCMMGSLAIGIRPGRMEYPSRCPFLFTYS
jgi:hypothetical protein